MSLPWLLGITLDNLPTEPYLRVPGGMVPPLPAASRRRVGVVWESGLWGVASPIWGASTNLSLPDYSPKSAGFPASSSSPCSREGFPPS